MMTRWRPRWMPSSVRFRLLVGLALLVVAGMAASSVAGAYLLEDFLEDRYEATLDDTAVRIGTVIDAGPQEANGDQLAALVAPPLGLVAVDGQGRALERIGSGERVASESVRTAASQPPGNVDLYEDAENPNELSAVLIPSPGLTITQEGRDDIEPAALILLIDTSVDDATIRTLVGRQLMIVGSTLVLLLGLAVVVLRVGMRPLSRMASSAEAIAAGSLTDRLPTRGDRSETDQLAHAVNRAFDAQARAEQTVRSFVADTSHELRTPLSTISGWLDLRRQGGMSADQLENALGHIDNEVGRMRLVVEELGLLARLDAGRPLEQERVDVRRLAESVVEDARVVDHDRDITLEASGPAWIVGDEVRLQQVLRNLVGNAVLHTPPDAAVVVSIAMVDATVVVKVIDNGPGIPTADLPRVFERFWRAEASRSRAHGGSGLGLAIVQAIVSAHGARVAVASTVGVGTTVTVTFSAAQDEPIDGGGSERDQP